MCDVRSAVPAWAVVQSLQELEVAVSVPIGVYSGPPPFALRDKSNKVDHVVGLDLGKEMDYSALVVLERSVVRDLARANSRPFNIYSLRWIERWVLNTLYTEIIPEVTALVARDPLKMPLLAVDYTGPGESVVDFLRAAKPKARIHPIQITAGSAVTQKDGHWHVSKSVLISTLQVLIQSERLKVASGPEVPWAKWGDLLEKEFNNFKRKTTAAGNETFEAWRSKDHDDLVMAVAIACWLGEQHGGHDHFPSKQPNPQRPKTPMDMNRARGANWRRRGLFGSKGDPGRKR